MAAPQFTPTPVVDTARAYGSPDVVPHAWSPDRPGDIVGFQPSGDRLGYQGPDQGFAIKIANGFKDRLQLQPGEHAADAIKGCLGVGLRRASMFSRAPVVHDLTIAFTIWGFLTFALDSLAIAAQALTGRSLGAGDREGTRATTQLMAYPARWRELTGL